MFYQRDQTDNAMEPLFKLLNVLIFIVSFIIGFTIGLIIRKIKTKIQEARLKKQIEKEETRLQSAPRLIFELNPEVLTNKEFIAIRNKVEMQALSHYFRKVVKEKSLILYSNNIKSWKQFTQPQSDSILENILYPLADDTSKADKTRNTKAIEKR